MKLSLVAVLTAVCLSCLSSVYARDMNLSDAKYPVMSTYAAEAYLAFDIYTQSKANSETGEKLYYTPNNYAVLEYYYFDNRTGFNAGVYRLKNGRFVVAFGGTMASEDGATKSSAFVDSIGDILTDINLLNTRRAIYQPYQAMNFIDSNTRVKEFNLTAKNTTLTGHSLGGGLAQHVSVNTDIPAVTFNTAPLPIPYNQFFNYDTPDLSRFGNPVNITNIMSNRDPLTATLEVIEDHENGGHDPSLPSHGGELLGPISEMLNEFDPDNYMVALAAGWLTAASTPIQQVINQSASYGVLDTVSKTIENTASYYKALQALKEKDTAGFIENVKAAYEAGDLNYSRLIIGSRHILDTDTGHSMIQLIEESYRNINATELDRLKEIHPEFYSYIDGSFENEGVPFPTGSAISKDLAARVMYYFYTVGYEALLEDEWQMYFDLANNSIVTQEKIDAFANKWLGVDALAAQAMIAMDNAFTSYTDEPSDEVKKRAVGILIDSGKGEVYSAIYPESVEAAVSAIETCIVGMTWLPSVSDGIQEVIGKIPDKILGCAVGKVVEATGRFVNSAKGILSLQKYNEYKLAKVYMDTLFRCGLNDICMSLEFGGNESYDDRLDYLIEQYGLGFGQRDWSVRRGAKAVIEDYLEKIKGHKELVLGGYLSSELINEYQLGNKQSYTLDATIEPVNIKDGLSEITLDITLQNTSGREIQIDSARFLMISSGVETDITDGVDETLFVNQILPSRENKEAAGVPISLPVGITVDGTFRLAVIFGYHSTDNVFVDYIQRIQDIEPSAPEAITAENENTQGFTDTQLIAVHLFNLPLDQLNYDYNSWGENPHLYHGTSGHAGIDVQTKDVAGGNPNNNFHPFYSLTDGEVISAQSGSTYNLISIYDAVSDVSTVYLHAKEIDVQVGDSVRVGDRLGVQGDKGITGAWHVHVEVRSGRKTYAAINKTGTLDPEAYLVGNIQNLPVDFSGEELPGVSSTRTIKMYDVYDADNNFVRTVDTFYLSGTCNENIIIESGSVYVRGSAKINGNLIHSGELYINGGHLVVRGDLVQLGGYITLKSDGGDDSQLYVNGGYRLTAGGLAIYDRARVEVMKGLSVKGISGASAGSISMLAASAYLKVLGDFVIDSTQQSIMNAGTFELKGDFTQLSSSESYYAPVSFNNWDSSALNTHRVLLTGSVVQRVSFEDYGYSRFDGLYLGNTSKAGIEFRTPVLSQVLSGNSGQVVGYLPSFGGLAEDTIIKGNLTLAEFPYQISRNGHTLTLIGNITQKSGHVELYDEGKQVSGLSVQGNYRLTGGTLSLFWSSPAGHFNLRHFKFDWRQIIISRV